MSFTRASLFVISLIDILFDPQVASIMKKELNAGAACERDWLEHGNRSSRFRGGNALFHLSSVSTEGKRNRLFTFILISLFSLYRDFSL